MTQATALLVVSRLTLTIVFFSAPLDVKQDVWWQSLPAALLPLLLVWVAERWLWRRFPDLSLPEVAELLLGKLAGRMLALLYAGFFLLQFGLALRLTAEFFAFSFLSSTPMLVIVAIVAALSAWAARAGVEVMGRAGLIVFPVLTGAVILIFLLLFKDLQTRYLLPLEILKTGPIPHLRDMLNVGSRTVEFLWLATVYPAIAEKQRVLRGAVAAQLWIGLLWVLVGVVTFGTLGREVERYYFPFFVAARTVSIADFLERIDALFPAVWMFGMFLRGGMLLWAAAVNLTRAFGGGSSRPLVPGLAALGVTLTFLQAENFVELQSYLRPEILTPFMLTFIWVIPLLVMLPMAAWKSR